MYSSLEDDPDLREEIDEFVVRLAERVDALQDAHLEGRARDLIALVGELEAESRRLGFDGFADAATQIAVACAEEKPETTEEGLLELTELARRIRLGHRGAA